MILRNLTTTPQTLTDGPELKNVSPQGLVVVSPEKGFELLTHHPEIWMVEQAIVPPPP
jgi:hypothetical protein